MLSLGVSWVSKERVPTISTDAPNSGRRWLLGTLTEMPRPSGAVRMNACDEISRGGVATRPRRRTTMPGLRSINAEKDSGQGSRVRIGTIVFATDFFVTAGAFAAVFFGADLLVGAVGIFAAAIFLVGMSAGGGVFDAAGGAGLATAAARTGVACGVFAATGVVVAAVMTVGGAGAATGGVPGDTGAADSGCGSFAMGVGFVVPGVGSIHSHDAVPGTRPQDFSWGAVPNVVWSPIAFIVPMETESPELFS